jgi:hypothetical protein
MVTSSQLSGWIVVDFEQKLRKVSAPDMLWDCNFLEPKMTAKVMRVEKPNPIAIEKHKGSRSKNELAAILAMV